MKKQKIYFKATEKRDSSIKIFPEPSVKHIPEWFKSIKTFSNGDTDYLKASKHAIDTKTEVNATVKACVPFLDTMSSGYTVLLPATILVTKTEIGQRIDWKTSFPILDVQPQQALGSFPIPRGCNQTFFRWIMNSRFITPKGYSILITHPSQRYDLPFQTLSGIIDTDNHKNPLLLPFFLDKDFEGFIEEGTPIAQAFPIKREIWESECMPYTEDEKFVEDRTKSSFFRTYKKKYWERKEYR